MTNEDPNRPGTSHQVEVTVRRLAPEDRAFFGFWVQAGDGDGEGLTFSFGADATNGATVLYVKDGASYRLDLRTFIAACLAIENSSRAEAPTC